MTRRALLLGLAVTALTLASAARAEEYPVRPVRLVVPYPPGSGTDIVARLLAQSLSDRMGQQVFVDNRPGAGGTVGTDAAAKAAPDGYTLLISDLGPLAIAPSFYPKLPYDPVRDLAPVSQVAVLPFVLVTNPSVPARTVPQLIGLAKASPGTLSYASVGNGTAVHLATELFRQLAGIDIVHVPYRGSAPALTDVVAGRVGLMFVNVLSAMSFVQGGQLRALAIGTGRRSAAFPDLPTVAESGLPGFEASVWFGLLAPAGTPASVMSRLNQETSAALAAPELKAKLAQQGAEIVPGSAEEFGAKIREETGKWADVVRKAGLKLE